MNRPQRKNSNTIIVRDLSIVLTSTDISSTQKINKERLALNDMLDQMDLTYIYNIASKSNRIYILLKYTWNILQDRSYVKLKPNLNKLKKI